MQTAAHTQLDTDGAPILKLSVGGNWIYHYSGLGQDRMQRQLQGTPFWDEWDIPDSPAQFDRREALYKPGHGSAPAIPLDEIIQWIRVYKNPEVVPTADFTTLSGAAQGPYPGYDMSSFGFERRNAYINPSYNDDGEGGGSIWVKFDPETGELFPDPDEPGQSGQVTATENTSVKIGDRVAIAVNIKGWGGRCITDLAIGELIWREDYQRQSGARKVDARRWEPKWRLNPNMPLWHYALAQREDWRAAGLIVSNDPSPTTGDLTPLGASHTLVYQFVVTADHVELNDGGPWMKRHFTQERTEVTDSYGTIRSGVSRAAVFDVDEASGYIFRKFAAIDLFWTENAFGKFPSSSTVSPFNTWNTGDRFRVNWGALGASGKSDWTYLQVDATSHQDADRNGAKVYVYDRFENFPWDNPKRMDRVSHRHIPMYDPANPPDPETGGPIYYPKIELPDTPATTTIEVPGGTQTGAFTVTLSFTDESGLFEGHDFSAAGVSAFKTALTEKLSAAGWTVTSLTSDVRVASSGEDIISHGDSARYSLTLVPPLGAKGDVELQIPAGIVEDAAETGNLAASVMVEVDAPLRLAEGKAVAVAEPEGGAYLADAELEVLVPFAEEGLTYEGDNPPYLTIYLGEGTANPRHATWQQGEETEGSTVVPFRYVIAATDPIVSSVRVDAAAGVLIPTGTKLESRSGRSSLDGTDAPAMASGKKAPVPDAAEKAGFATATGAAVTSPEVEVQVLPAVYLPPTEESAPKAGMSSIPRSPIVFNELGNGSGNTNDWLELRNVTGDAVSLKDWELSVVQDGKKEDTSLVVFPDVSVPAEGLLLITNSDPTAEGNLLAGGDDIDTAKAEVKGSSHLYLVNAGLSLPDDGQFLLILRNAKEKRGLNEAFVDVAGGGGSGTDAFVREQEGDYDTYVWPLQVLEAPGSATEDALSSGKVWLRAKADIVGYHRDAWAEAAFTGVGYDRKVTKSAETAGTPGYPNGAVKTEAATPRGAITISEVMLDSAGGTLPQWVELYNSSKTDALNINRWELEIQNVADSEDLVGRPVVRLTLQEKIIQPNQTLLIVTGNARASSADVYPADRVYNLLELHDKNLRIKKPSDTFLSAKGFYLRLTDRNENVVDEVGNTDGNRRTDDTPAWALPVPLSELEGMRSSLVRRYDKGVARDGKEKSSWALAANFAKFKAAELHYGHADDIGTPGYRQGGALPVELSSFTVTRIESGSVIVTWTTESEVDNAGFNLRRSLTREGGYTLLNPALIAGAGTTGERQTYTYIDTSAKPGVEHYYQIEEVSFGGKAETLVTRRLRGPVSPAHRALKTLGEVKQLDE